MCVTQRSNQQHRTVLAAALLASMVGVATPASCRLGSRGAQDLVFSHAALPALWTDLASDGSSGSLLVQGITQWMQPPVWRYVLPGVRMPAGSDLRDGASFSFLEDGLNSELSRYDACDVDTSGALYVPSTSWETELACPSGSPTPSTSPSSTSSATATATSSVSGTLTVTRSASASGTSTATGSPSAAATVTPSATASASGTASTNPSFSVTITPSLSGSATSTATSSATRTATVSSSTSASSSLTATGSPSTAATVTPSTTASASGTASSSGSATASASRSGSPTSTTSATASPTGRATVSSTFTPSASVTASVSGSVTGSVTPSASVAATVTASATGTSSSSFTPSTSASPSGSATSTATSSATMTPTVSSSTSVSSSLTATGSPSAAATVTSSATASPSGTASSSGSATASVTASSSGSVSSTASVTPTTGSSSPTITPSSTLTPSASMTVSATTSVSASPSASSTSAATLTPSPSTQPWYLTREAFLPWPAALEGGIEGKSLPQTASAAASALLGLEASRTRLPVPGGRLVLGEGLPPAPLRLQLTQATSSASLASTAPHTLVCSGDGVSPQAAAAADASASLVPPCAFNPGFVVTPPRATGVYNAYKTVFSVGLAEPLPALAPGQSACLAALACTASRASDGVQVASANVPVLVTGSRTPKLADIVLERVFRAPSNSSRWLEMAFKPLWGGWSTAQLTPERGYDPILLTAASLNASLAAQAAWDGSSNFQILTSGSATATLFAAPEAVVEGVGPFLPAPGGDGVNTTFAVVITRSGSSSFTASASDITVLPVKPLFLHFPGMVGQVARFQLPPASTLCTTTAGRKVCPAVQVQITTGGASETQLLALMRSNGRDFSAALAAFTAAGGTSSTLLVPPFVRGRTLTAFNGYAGVGVAAGLLGTDPNAAPAVVATAEVVAALGLNLASNATTTEAVVAATGGTLSLMSPPRSTSSSSGGSGSSASSNSGGGGSSSSSGWSLSIIPLQAAAPAQLPPGASPLPSPSAWPTPGVIAGGGSAGLVTGASAAPGPSSSSSSSVAASGPIYGTSTFRYVEQCAGPYTDPTTSNACTNVNDPKRFNCALGSGEDCRLCPSDVALCPGGNAITPLPGYWVPDPSQASEGEIVRCLGAAAAVRCPGGVGSNGLVRCGAAYRDGSYACSACAAGFFPSAEEPGVCSPCPPAGTLWQRLAPVLTVVGYFLAAAVPFAGVIIYVTKKFDGDVKAALKRGLQFVVTVWSGLAILVQAAVISPSLPAVTAKLFARLQVLQFQGVSLHPLCTGNVDPLSPNVDSLIFALVLLGVLTGGAVGLYYTEKHGRLSEAPPPSTRRLFNLPLMLHLRAHSWRALSKLQAASPLLLQIATTIAFLLYGRTVSICYNMLACNPPVKMPVASYLKLSTPDGAALQAAGYPADFETTQTCIALAESGTTRRLPAACAPVMAHSLDPVSVQLLTSQPYILCGEGSHVTAAGLSIAAIVLYGVLLPLGGYAVLQWRRRTGAWRRELEGKFKLTARRGDNDWRATVRAKLSALLCPTRPPPEATQYNEDPLLRYYKGSPIRGDRGLYIVGEVAVLHFFAFKKSFGARVQSPSEAAGIFAASTLLLAALFLYAYARFPFRDPKQRPIALATHVLTVLTGGLTYSSAVLRFATEDLTTVQASRASTPADRAAAVARVEAASATVSRYGTAVFVFALLDALIILLAFLAPLVDAAKADAAKRWAETGAATRARLVKSLDLRGKLPRLGLQGLGTDSSDIEAAAAAPVFSIADAVTNPMVAAARAAAAMQLAAAIAADEAGAAAGAAGSGGPGFTVGEAAVQELVSAPAAVDKMEPLDNSDATAAALPGSGRGPGLGVFGVRVAPRAPTEAAAAASSPSFSSSNHPVTNPMLQQSAGLQVSDRGVNFQPSGAKPGGHSAGVPAASPTAASGKGGAASPARDPASLLRGFAAKLPGKGKGGPNPRGEGGGAVFRARQGPAPGWGSSDTHLILATLASAAAAAAAAAADAAVPAAEAVSPRDATAEKR